MDELTTSNSSAEAQGTYVDNQKSIGQNLKENLNDFTLK